MTFTNTIKSVAAAAALTVAALAPAHASIDAIDTLEIDLAPSIVAPVDTVTANADLDSFIDRLKNQRDDGTLNPEDYRKIRQFQTASADLDAFIDRLKNQRDDGTLNSEDYRKIRQFQA